MQRALAAHPTENPKRAPLQWVLVAYDAYVLRRVLDVGSLSCSSSTKFPKTG